MEITIEQKLRSLFELQTIDSKIDQIRRLRGELPLEVKDLEDVIVGKETHLNKLETELADLMNRIAEKKAIIKETTSNKAKYEAQLMNVKNSREYDALSKEIEVSGLDIQLAEKRIREYSTLTEQKKAEITEFSQQIATYKADLEIKKSELSSIVSETEREENELIKISDSLSGKIENRLIAAYKKLRNNSRNGLGIVTVERDSCNGCFNKIPPQRQLDIKSHKRIIICEHCGRILIDPALADEVTQQVENQD